MIIIDFDEQIEGWCRQDTDYSGAQFSINHGSEHWNNQVLRWAEANGKRNELNWCISLIE